MNPETVFCPKLSCAARGKVGAGNIHVHSEPEGRYRCDVCHETFTTSYGPIFYRLRTAPDLVMIVLVLLANGCPIPAIVAAYGFDERTIKSWWKRGGVHCEAVHTHVIGQSKLELVQVQADEIRVKIWGGVVWMALAIMVPTRLWVGGVISPRRDKALIQHLADQIRACALCRPLLLAVDGLASYPAAFKRAFRAALPRRRGRPGRPREHHLGRCRRDAPRRRPAAQPPRLGRPRASARRSSWRRISWRPRARRRPSAGRGPRASSRTPARPATARRRG